MRADRARRGAQRRRGPRARRLVSSREVVLAALERWRPATGRGRRDQGLLGRRARLRWRAIPVAMAQALDNLIANALEHGGPPLVVTAARVSGRLRLTLANGRSGDERRSGSGDPRRRGTGSGSSATSPSRTPGASRSARRARAASPRSSCRSPSQSWRGSRRRGVAAAAGDPVRGGRCPLRARGRDDRRPLPHRGRRPLRRPAPGPGRLGRHRRGNADRARAGERRPLGAAGARRASCRRAPSAGPSRRSGRAPGAAIPAGSYVIGAQLERARARGAGRRPAPARAAAPSRCRSPAPRR